MFFQQCPSSSVFILTLSSLFLSPPYQGVSCSSNNDEGLIACAATYDPSLDGGPNGTVHSIHHLMHGRSCVEVCRYERRDYAVWLGEDCHCAELSAGTPLSPPSATCVDGDWKVRVKIKTFKMQSAVCGTSGVKTEK